MLVEGDLYTQWLFDRSRFKESTIQMIRYVQSRINVINVLHLFIYCEPER